MPIAVGGGGSGASVSAANTWTQKQTFSGEIEVDGNLNHDGTAVGFFGQTPQTRPSAYVQTAFSLTSRTVPAAASESHALNTVFSDAEVESALDNLGIAINSVMKVVNQMIDDFQARGDFQ